MSNDPFWVLYPFAYKWKILMLYLDQISCLYDLVIEDSE